MSSIATECRMTRGIERSSVSRERSFNVVTTNARADNDNPCKTRQQSVASVPVVFGTTQLPTEGW